MKLHRRRRHRVPILNLIEEEMGKCKESVSMDDDIGLWKRKDDVFKSKFSSKSTGNLIRTPETSKEWSKGVWFLNATPKFAFLAWLAIHNRLSTGERMLRWGGGVTSMMLVPFVMRLLKQEATFISIVDTLQRFGRT